MKKIIAMIMLTLAFAASAADSVLEENYKEEKITIKKSGAFDKEKQALINVGSKVTFEIKVYESDFFGNTIISANAKMTNKLKEKVTAVYFISFFDKDGKLVGCTQGSWDIDPSDDINYGSGLIKLNAKSIKTVTSYKLRTVVLKCKK